MSDDLEPIGITKLLADADTTDGDLRYSCAHAQEARSKGQKKGGSLKHVTCLRQDLRSSSSGRKLAQGTQVTARRTRA